jgi:hypothetical protein
MNPWEGFEEDIFGMSADELFRQGRCAKVDTQFLVELVIILLSNMLHCSTGWGFK